MIALFGEYFSLNSQGLAIILVSLIIFSVGIFILFQNPSRSANQSFFWICMAVNFWLFGLAFMYMSHSEIIALSVYRHVAFLGVSFVATLVYLYSVIWLDLWAKQRVGVYCAFAGSIFFYALTIFTPLGVDRMLTYPWGRYPHYAIGNCWFFLYFFPCFIAAFFNFVSAYQKCTSSVRRDQICLISIAFLVSFCGSVDYVPKIWNVAIYPFGFLCVLAWILIVAYTIVSHKWMGIETVIHKTLMWGTLSSAIFIPLGFMISFLNNWQRNHHSSIAMLGYLLSFAVFLSYAKTIQPWIDHLFQRRKHNLEKELIHFSDSLVELKGMQELVEFVAKTLREVLYTEETQIYLRSALGNDFKAVYAKDRETFKLTHSNPMLSWCGRQDRIIQRRFLEIDPELSEICSEGQRWFEDGDEVLLPLTLNRELIGIMVLGRKTNLKSYQVVEIKFLTDLIRSATMAFSNTLRMIEMQEKLHRWNDELEEKVRLRTDELEEAQKQLLQAEKLATLGTLAGGVAHEINNPLTAVLTNAQLLKLLFDSDPDARESLDLIEQGAKRCQAIIKNLMKYSRPHGQGQSRELVALERCIENVRSFVGYQLEQDNIRLELKILNKAMIFGVQTEIEQVLTNLILNARDALLKKEGGLIAVELAEEAEWAILKISDTGDGISTEDIAKVFDPFFTTKDIGKGTGLGLSVTLGIISRHQGTIDVKSEEGRGAEFILRLPSANKVETQK